MIIKKFLRLFISEKRENNKYHQMTDNEFVQFHEDRYNKLPKWIVYKSIDVLKQELPERTKKEFREAYYEDPINWMSQYHFWGGMSIRNLLRDKVCLDQELSENEEYQNWDNYYTKLVELAIGVKFYE